MYVYKYVYVHVCISSSLHRSYLGSTESSGWVGGWRSGYRFTPGYFRGGGLSHAPWGRVSGHSYCREGVRGFVLYVTGRGSHFWGTWEAACHFPINRGP